jgi:transposase-like protein
MNDEVNIFEFTQTFPTEGSCIAFLEYAIWPDGKILSPFSGKESYRLGTRPGVYKCKETRQNFSVRHGTIFEESRLPLKKWFFAIFLLNSLKNGISSIQLAKYLGITQKSAWFMLQRIRYGVEHDAFKQPLHGVAEMDKTYHGRHHTGRRGRRTEVKTPVAGMMQCEGENRCEAVASVKTRKVGPIVRENVRAFSMIAVDELGIYSPIVGQTYRQHLISHGSGEYFRGSTCTDSAEGFWSRFKRGIKGLYIQVSGKHLSKSSKGYEFRFNRNKINDVQRFGAWFGRCFGSLTYQSLTT